MTVVEQVDSRKLKYGGEEAVELARGANKLWVMRGKNVRHFDMKKDAPTDDELKQVMLGPTGNLRAPTIRAGKKLFVGFNLDEYQTQLG